MVRRITLCLMLLAAAPAAAWEDRAPVVSASPVYDEQAARADCPAPSAGPVDEGSLVGALREDLARATCVGKGRPVGWEVIYRYAGRDYRMIMPDHPGDYVPVRVQVRSRPSTRTARHR